ncbi:MAG: T9SS C-terminal target domain-containing protein, partial [Bacteroidia bacterium]
MKIEIKLLALFILSMLCHVDVVAQKPVIKVDLNFSGRNEAEVHEKGYVSWPVVSGKSDQRTIGGIKFELNGNYNSAWYKAGVQAPYYAKLVNDGLKSSEPLELTISGLPAGSHSLMSYHNNFDNADGGVAPSTIAIYVDGKLAEHDIVPSNRAEHNTKSQVTYLSLQAKAGVPIVVRYQVDGTSSSPKHFTLNGFEINTPDLRKQAKMPMPIDADEHVAVDKDLMLKWTAAADAVSHDVYFGTNKGAVENASHSSQEFKGTLTTTSYSVKNLYSMETYYWRIDEKDASGKVTKGNIWYFRPAQLAFPGAEGYGRFARGGRGGKVVHVTNLNDSGPGSLREAVNLDIGPRTIVFDVAGIIKLSSRLVINQPYVTVAGQTAPGKGITIVAAPLGLTGNDGVVRFIRVRVGAGRTYDGMGLTGANHSIIDHCSISWTIDEAFSSRGAHNISLQRTLISEALNVADHGKYEKGKMHGYAATIGGDIGSFHHNLLVHNYGRNWSMGGGLDGNGVYSGRLDIRNNVVYNWGRRTTDGGAKEVNFVSNYYKPG